MKNIKLSKATALFFIGLFSLWALWTLVKSRPGVSAFSETNAGFFKLKLPNASNEAIDSDQLIDSLRIIPLSFSENAQVRAVMSISDVAISRDKILLTSEKLQILGFDLNGNFLNQLVSQGEGPGEALQVLDYVVQDGKVYVLQSANPNIHVFDLNGFQYLRSFRIDPEYVYYQFDYFNGKWFFFAANNFGTPYSIHVYDKDFSRIVEMTLPNQLKIKSFTAIPSPPFYKGQDFFHIRSEFNDTIFQYDADKGVSPFLVVDFGNHRIGRREIEVLEKGDFDQASRLNASFDFSKIMKYAETDRHIFMSVILSKEKTINEIIVDKKNRTMRQLSDMKFPGSDLPLHCIGVLPDDFFVFSYTDEADVDQIKSTLTKGGRKPTMDISNTSAFLVLVRFK
ncbi:MAG: 6-bladed beta-propeller [Haliscomenobacter sp.]|nr:6-bladed beta-propeller [Haliscomenobacter sp.]